MRECIPAPRRLQTGVIEVQQNISFEWCFEKLLEVRRFQTDVWSSEIPGNLRRAGCPGPTLLWDTRPARAELPILGGM